jgi:predicted TIM-barrel fold metal-dependent hydrolase
VTWAVQTGYRHLLLSGVFERFPKLKYIVTESGCGWAGPLLKNLDGIHRNMVGGQTGEIKYTGEWILKEPPSAYAKRNCFYGASFPSKADLAGIDVIGEDNVLWGNDYPHFEGTFPHNLESLRLTFAEVPDSRRRKVFGLNAARLYNFDVDLLKQRAAAVGPSPAQINDPLPFEAIPRGTGCYLFSTALAENTEMAA